MVRKKLRNVVSFALAAGLCLGLVNAAEAKPEQVKPPNVVLVLIDDFSVELLKTMRHTSKLKRDGASFPNAFVADSLCCTSRTSFLTGRYPHNTGVKTNSGPEGGWDAFQKGDNGKKTFAYAMNTREGRRYRTALQGKFLNGYNVRKGESVPPGWTQWNAVGGGGYKQWQFTMAGERKNGVLGKPRTYKSLKDDGYATNVLSRRAERFIADSNKNHKGRPYFLEVAPYATHSTLKDRAHERDPLFPSALRDRPTKTSNGNCGTVNCKSLKAADLPGFDNPTANNRPQYGDGSNAPHWQNDKPMREHDREVATKRLQDRARMAQSVDRMVGKIRAAAGPHTYIVVTSDNGFHLGQHRARIGKGTAYDYDIRVPLIVYKKAEKKSDRLTPGPRPQVVSNIDLAPTLRELGRTRLDDGRDGVSLVDALWHPKSAKGPKYAFVEHTQPARKGKDAAQDPDLDVAKGGTSSVPSYQAVRSKDALLVRYEFGDRSAWEYYRYHPGKKDGMVEQVNTYRADMDTAQVKSMKAALAKFRGCKGTTCRAARTAT